MGEPVVEHICQNSHKYMQVSQVHLIRQNIQYWPLVEADLLQHITDFAVCNQHLTGSRFYLQKVQKVGEIAAKPLNQEIRQADKMIMKIHPQRFVIHFSTLSFPHISLLWIFDNKKIGIQLK